MIADPFTPRYYTLLPSLARVHGGAGGLRALTRKPILATIARRHASMVVWSSRIIFSVRFSSLFGGTTGQGAALLPCLANLQQRGLTFDSTSPDHYCRVLHESTYSAGRQAHVQNWRTPPRFFVQLVANSRSSE